MDARAFELLVITPEEEFPEETGWVNRLFAEGLGTLHLRKPRWDADRLMAYLNEIDKCFHSRIMLHDYFGYHPGRPKTVQLREFSLKGRHYPYVEFLAQNETIESYEPGKPYEPDKLKDEGMLSCSTHSWQEFMQVSKGIDYAFISPFFDSISKEGYTANKGLQMVPEQVAKSKAVALGGIFEGNIDQLLRLEFKGAAVLGAVWQAANPLMAYRKLVHQIMHA